MIQAVRPLRAAVATFSISFSIPRRDLMFLAVGALLRVLMFCVLVGIWRGISAGGAVLSDAELQALLSYTAIAQMLAPILDVRTTVAPHIAGGSIAVRALWPMGLSSQFLSEWLGRTFPGLILGAVSVAFAASALGVSLLPASPVHLIVLSFVLAIVVGLQIDFAFALITVNLNNGIWFVSSIRTACTGILSGALIPLTVFPWGVGEVLTLLPFASMAFGPLSIYTGTSSVLQVLIIQTAWALFGWFALKACLKKVRDKVVSSGG